MGPMQGLAHNFLRYTLNNTGYGIKGYVNETCWLYGVLEKHLKDAKSYFLAGNKCTIADVTHNGWVL